MGTDDVAACEGGRAHCTSETSAVARAGESLVTDGAPRQCTVFVSSDAPHVAQIYAGFDLLARSGELRVQRRIARPIRPRTSVPAHLRDAHLARVDVLFAHGPRLVYDMHDSWEVDSQSLMRADYLFKRSFAPDRLLTLGSAVAKVHALGLNYHVIGDQSDWFRLLTAMLWHRPWRNAIPSAATAFRWLDRFAYAPRVSTYESLPDRSLAPRALFIARAWDPAEIEHAGAEKVRDRIAVNERRAECIRTLRDEYGPRFVGGFMPSAFARARYPDLTDLPQVDGHKGRYLALARAIPICIATDGLHGSTGWKFAEYLALARAIVTEPLRYCVPGDLTNGIHYLDFDSCGRCVAQVARLMEDHELRFQIMAANAGYYRQWVRPDAIVRASLLRAFANPVRGGAGKP
jgi:hypothetical protein